MFAEVLLTDFISFTSSQPLDWHCGKVANCKRMEKSGNIRTCSDCSDSVQGKTTLSTEDPFENIEEILIEQSSYGS